MFFVSFQHMYSYTAPSSCDFRNHLIWYYIRVHYINTYNLSLFFAGNISTWLRNLLLPIHCRTNRDFFFRKGIKFFKAAVFSSRKDSIKWKNMSFTLVSFQPNPLLDLLIILFSQANSIWNFSKDLYVKNIYAFQKLKSAFLEVILNFSMFVHST